MDRPHIFLLGAGASIAACPYGDKNGKKLPDMKTLNRYVGLETVFREWGIDPSLNFERVYGDLIREKHTERISVIENRVREYFFDIEIPDRPTVYDCLVLSLRKKDLIATFNWDPLLAQAYARNMHSGLELPHLAFLHGGIGVKYCSQHVVASVGRIRCSKCNKILESSPLVFPTPQKDYTNPFIRKQWDYLKQDLKTAYILTVFGYRGASTEEKALNEIREGWGNKYMRDLEEIEFISMDDEEEISENWKDLINGDHYKVEKSFESTWAGLYPRRSSETAFKINNELEYANPSAIPTLEQLWELYGQIEG